MPAEPLKSTVQSDAMRRLGTMRVEISGPERDVPGGIALIRRAAALGEPSAYFWLGFYSYQGRVVPLDYAEAYRNFRIAWAGDVTRAALYIGRLYANGNYLKRDISEARAWYELAARRDDRESQFALGYSLIYNGNGANAKELASGIEWMQRAATAKYPAAIGVMARLHDVGQGMPADVTKAAALYQEAAELKDPYSISELGTLHIRGRGVAQDDARAIALFRQAIALGYVPAKSKLAWMYEFGRGVPRDPAEAARLYSEAAGVPLNANAPMN